MALGVAISYVFAAPAVVKVGGGVYWWYVCLDCLRIAMGASLTGAESCGSFFDWEVGTFCFVCLIFGVVHAQVSLCFWVVGCFWECLYSFDIFLRVKGQCREGMLTMKA